MEGAFGIAANLPLLPEPSGCARGPIPEGAVIAQ